MSSDSRSIPERRARSHKEIEDLVECRTGALSLYTELAAKQPFKPEQDTQRLLQTFCERLIDYTASAHFQLYRHIDEDRERRQPIRAIADEVYPNISDITQKILDFNDKYDCEDHCGDFSHLADDLSELGERLADRIELEDKLIAILASPRS
ncbi:MAG TPA: Rsd/AlgQ family anti-sigma factor [Gammaproteobacteria bacterium]|nr:Rsd/AlgQ family anti-sigma factor [Gammaproteobacteria bacterium]